MPKYNWVFPADAWNCHKDVPTCSSSHFSCPHTRPVFQQQNTLRGQCFKTCVFITRSVLRSGSKPKHPGDPKTAFLSIKWFFTPAASSYAKVWATQWGADTHVQDLDSQPFLTVVSFWTLIASIRHWSVLLIAQPLLLAAATFTSPVSPHWQQPLAGGNPKAVTLLSAHNTQAFNSISASSVTRQIEKDWVRNTAGLGRQCPPTPLVGHRALHEEALAKGSSGTRRRQVMAGVHRTGNCPPTRSFHRGYCVTGGSVLRIFSNRKPCLVLDCLFWTSFHSAARNF